MENDLQVIVNDMESLCIELEKFENWSLQKHAERIRQDLRNIMVVMRIDSANKKRSVIC